MYIISNNSLNNIDTKYNIIKQIAVLYQYQINEDLYNLIWTDVALSIKDIKSQHQNTKINHIPQITQITRKNKMTVNLNSMKNYFPKEYNFYPQSWILPSDYHKIVKKHTKGKIYIVKPDNGCQGQGIYLIDNPNRFEYQTNEVVQQYIMDPCLINGLKFDIRIYVLITCINPLRIFIYKDGIVRFATQKFLKPKQDNLDNLFSHLTNYAINKHNQNFVIDEQNPDNSHKRLFTSVFKNEEYSQLMDKISKIVLKTIIAGLPYMQNGYTQCKKTDPSSYFQLLGFDIILNSKKQPILLQVNQNPSLVTDTKFDYILKAELVQNIFDIISGGYNNLNDEKMQLKLKIKDRHEDSNKGNFIKIYPCQNFEQTEQYDQFIYKVNMIYSQRFGININKTSKKQKETAQSENLLSWKDQPYHYTKQKVQKIYGSRNTRTSTFKKRLIFI